MSERARVAVFCDSPDENWRAMDLAGEMLYREWSTRFADLVAPTAFTIDLPRIARRFAGEARVAFNLDRAAGRFLVYPTYAARQRGSFDFFHVVDHSYAHLVHVLPGARTGVFCHDVDAFRSLFANGGTTRAAWFRSIQRWTLTGLQRASVVFYSTEVVRSEIERHGLVEPARLVRAPYGISPEFDAVGRDDASARAVLAPLEGCPFLLHVGSAVPRKRLDVLFETFARVRATHPDLRLVQNGASLSREQREHVARLGIADALLQPGGKIDRFALAELYRRAKAVLVTSDSEGFGLPVIEALACGAVVFASDIPVLREVAGRAAILCPPGDPDQWSARVAAFLDATLLPPSSDSRLAHAAEFTWSNHARTILDAYCALESGDLPSSCGSGTLRGRVNRAPLA